MARCEFGTSKETLCERGAAQVLNFEGECWSLIGIQKRALAQDLGSFPPSDLVEELVKTAWARMACKPSFRACACIGGTLEAMLAGAS